MVGDFDSLALGEEAMTDAVAYMRCSGKGQLDGDTFDRQHESIQKYAADGEGIAILHEYREEGVSGKTDEESRPAFQTMIAELLGNGCRTIIVESLDRLARQYDIQQQLATYIASKGIALISANTGEDITAALMGDPMRRALVQIQGIFAELDKNLTVSKLRKARDRQKAKTGRCEGVKPYGSLPGEENGLRRICEYAAFGNADQIAYLMNENGPPTRSGGLWRASTIRKILARERTSNPVPEKAS